MNRGDRREAIFVDETDRRQSGRAQYQGNTTQLSKRYKRVASWNACEELKPLGPFHMLRPRTDKNCREAMKRESDIVHMDLESTQNLFERCRSRLRF